MKSGDAYGIHWPCPFGYLITASAPCVFCFEIVVLGFL